MTDLEQYIIESFSQGKEPTIRNIESGKHVTLMRGELNTTYGIRGFYYSETAHSHCTIDNLSGWEKPESAWDDIKSRFAPGTVAFALLKKYEHELRKILKKESPK